MTDQTPTPDLADFRRAYAADNNEWWRTDCGHHMNLFDDACDQLDTARDWAAWFAAERDQAVDYDGRLAYLGDMNRQLLDKLDESRAEAGAARGSALALQARVMELQSQVTARDKRITELESEAVPDRRAIEEARDERDAALTAPVGPDTSDGYHTFDELYRYRMLYNAAAFNAWAVAGLYDVHKSIRHSDGEECFGGGWFVVYAQLPTGQISNHYEQADWDLFRVPERERGAEWDGHTPAQVAERLAAFLGLESAPSSPHAYVAVKRYHSIHADGPEWSCDAAVIRATDTAECRHYASQGYELVPIVGTDAGTRHAAAQQSDPVGYMVVGRTRNGEPAEVCHAIWDSTENAALRLGDVAEASGFGRDDLFVAELREVNTNAE